MVCISFAVCSALASRFAEAPPTMNVWVRVDKVYSSEHGNDVVLLKDQPHKISGTAYGPTDTVDVWLDGKLVAHVPVTGAKGNMTNWPVWQATLPPMPAGFGHVVNVTSSNASSRNSSVLPSRPTHVVCQNSPIMVVVPGSPIGAVLTI